MTRLTRLSKGEGNPISAPQVLAGAPVAADTIHAAAQELLERLPERNRRILAERFGVGNGRPRTLVTIGNREGVSRERIRQIVESGLHILRTDTPVKGSAHDRVRDVFLSHFASFGGVATEDLLLSAMESTKAEDRSAIRFLLSSFTNFSEARETQRTWSHWIVPAFTTPRSTADAADAPARPSLETVLEAGERILERDGALIPEARYVEELRHVLGVPVTDTVLRSFLGVSKRIVRNPFGEFGLRAWRTAVPRSVGDKAYLVLKAHGKPLHFRAVADEINRLGFDRKRALAETVHNDLIRDSRFVLVGRGLYALREWGFTPGRVSDVIIRLLQEAERPLPKSDIVAEVLKQRFVKRNTVLLCLLNRSLFRSLPDDVYALADGDSTPMSSEPHGTSPPVGD